MLFKNVIHKYHLKNVIARTKKYHLEIEKCYSINDVFEKNVIQKNVIQKKCYS